MGYGIDRLKGKWNHLRKVHRLFSELLGHTGFTWDPNTNKVNAPDEVWQHFYMINKSEYKIFKNEGCKNYETLGEIFSGTTATGGLGNASTQLPPTSEEERQMSIESNVVGNMRTDDLTDEDSSDDDFLFTDDIVANFGDKQLVKDGKKVRVEEGVAMFLMIVGHTTPYSIIEIICPAHQNVPHDRILHKFPYFKNCIGAIDGTHVAAWAPTSRQTSFRGRKTNITQNVMLTCDFDMKFTFVYSGWEGTANDSPVFIDVVIRTSNNFPMLCGVFLSLVEDEDIICVIMLDEEDCVEMKNCSTIDIPCVVTLLNVALEF
ncbi:uncharacterized protein LOC127790090 [Diospyros lotus]|uniref:uncharacterized protein LOC127790090 n=1 Tax=Diospyros lotus TaxID=55363 RepID=UPI00224DC5EA|nr:uncharacterized protein LOC127790090 [Diospyros lotus]